MSKFKQLKISVLCGLVIAVLVSITAFQADCAKIREKTFRLHIIANSNSEADQNIKLAVRDEILKLTETIYADCKDNEQAKQATIENLKLFKITADNALSKAGFNYKSQAMVGVVNFNTREYEDFALPAGEYEALKIVLGDGEGENWWCVMYPKVCVSLCGFDEYESVLNDRQNNIINKKKEYKIAFRFVEVFSDLKRFVKKYL